MNLNIRHTRMLSEEFKPGPGNLELTFFGLIFWLSLQEFYLLSLEMVLNAKFKIPTGREILKGLPSARRKWNSETALENYCYLYGVGKASFDLIRVPLFREDVRTQHWFGLFSIPLISSHVMLVFYTIFYYNAEFENFLPCTCMAGLGLSVRKHCCNWAQ